MGDFFVLPDNVVLVFLHLSYWVAKTGRICIRVKILSSSRRRGSTIIHSGDSRLHGNDKIPILSVIQSKAKNLLYFQFGYKLQRKGFLSIVRNDVQL